MPLSVRCGVRVACAVRLDVADEFGVRDALVEGLDDVDALKDDVEVPLRVIIALRVIVCVARCVRLGVTEGLIVLVALSDFVMVFVDELAGDAVRGCDGDAVVRELVADIVDVAVAVIEAVPVMELVDVVELARQLRAPMLTGGTAKDGMPRMRLLSVSAI